MASLGCYSLPQSLARVAIPYIIMITLTISLFLPFPAKPMAVSGGLLVPSSLAVSVRPKPCLEKQFYIPQALSDWDNNNNLQSKKSRGLNNIKKTFPGMTVTGYPWDDPGYQKVSASTLISVEAKPTSVENTVQYFMPTPLVAPAVGIQSVPTTPLVPVDFSHAYLTPSPLNPTPKKFDSGIGLISDRTVPSFSDSGSHTSMGYLNVPPWTYWPHSSHPGVTVVPPSVPKFAISTFFGSLGLARSKAYVIPVDTDGVPGWHKRALETEKKAVEIVGDKTNAKDVNPTTLGPLVPTSRTTGELVAPTLC